MSLSPKVIHPWYDVVAEGGKYAVEELAKEGIKVNVIWDQPPQADVVDQNQRIEANIGRHPDGLAVACLDQATNVQLLTEARDAGINVLTFNSFCDDAFPFIGPKSSEQDGYDLGEFLAKRLEKVKARSRSFPAVSRHPITFSASRASRRRLSNIRKCRSSSSSPTMIHPRKCGFADRVGAVGAS